MYLFTTDRTLWPWNDLHRGQFREARPFGSGTFVFDGVPPGEYFVTAAVLAAPETWRTPDGLDRLAQMSVRVRLDEGDRITQTLGLHRQ